MNPPQQNGLVRLTHIIYGLHAFSALMGVISSAAVVSAFLTGCFRIPVYDGYGSTEAGVISIDGEICRPAVTAYKLAQGEYVTLWRLESLYSAGRPGGSRGPGRGRPAG